MRTTIKDIANQLGVSANTVSKALNGKPQVSEETRKLVLETAARMNYSPNESARALARREFRIAVVFPLEPKEFYGYMIEGIREATQMLSDMRCRVIEYPYPAQEQAEALKKVLEQVAQKKPDALVLTCSFNFEVYRRELEAIAGSGIPILYNTIFGQEIPGVIGGIRTDTLMAGKIAAEFLGLAMAERETKDVALIVGEKELLVYRECIEGFFADAFKYGLRIVGIYETHTEKENVYAKTDRIMQEHPDLAGIYVAMHNAIGVCDCLEERYPDKKISVIGHDLYPALNRRLRKHSLSATLFQNQFEYGKTSVLMAAEYLIGKRSPEDCGKRIVPRLVLSSMVDSFSYYDREEV